MKRLLFISLIVSFILIGCDSNHSNSSSRSAQSSRSKRINNNNYQPSYSKGPMSIVDDEGFEYSMFDTRAPARNGDTVHMTKFFFDIFFKRLFVC